MTQREREGGRGGGGGCISFGVCGLKYSYISPS